jgi:hypothetical protein
MISLKTTPAAKAGCVTVQRRNKIKKQALKTVFIPNIIGQPGVQVKVSKPIPNARVFCFDANRIVGRDEARPSI